MTGSSSGLSVDELQHKIAILEVEKQKEHDINKHLQSERDHILKFWEITKLRYSQAQKELLDASIVQQDLIQSHSNDIKVFRQRLRHLLVQHEEEKHQIHSEANIKLESLKQELMQQARSEQQRLQTELDQERAAKLAAQLEINTCRAECEEKISSQSRIYTDKLSEMQVKYQQDWMTAQSNMQAACDAEIRAAQAKMDASLDLFQTKQQETLQKLHQEFDSQVAEFMSQIQQLKEDSIELIDREAAAQRAAKEAITEQSALQDSLKHLQEELDITKRDLRVAKTEGSLLQTAKQRLAAVEKKCRALQLENESLLVKIECNSSSSCCLQTPN